MPRPPKIKYDAIKLTIEAVIQLKGIGTDDIEDSIERALDDLRMFGMAKVIVGEPTEYPEYEVFHKERLMYMELSPGGLSIRVD